MQIDDIVVELRLLATAEHCQKMAHFGINNSKALGVKTPLLRVLAKKIGKNHEMALALWETGIHEARILASLIEDPKEVTENQFDNWVSDFNSWDICDVCAGLLSKTTFVNQKIIEYSTHSDEFVKRTSFSLMCQLAFHNKKMTNEMFFPFFEIIERESWDDRNFVRKALNWALRQIGKRNETLRLKAVDAANRILLQNTKSANWIAKDALRELGNEKIISRILKSRT